MFPNNQTKIGLEQTQPLTFTWNEVLFSLTSLNSFAMVAKATSVAAVQERGRGEASNSNSILNWKHLQVR